MNSSGDSLSIDTDFLKNIVQQVLVDPDIRLKDWEAHQIKSGLEIGSNIYKLSGTADLEKTIKSWSLILKIVHPEEQFSDPEGYRYWEREIQAYQSGLFDSLPGHFSAPKLYQICEKPERSIWIFMEDIQDEFIRPWTLEQYNKAAHLLGKFNGAYLAGRSLPQKPWLCKQWLLKYVEHATPMIELIQHNPAHPLIKSLLPGISLPLTLSFWDVYPKLIKIINSLPQTFCHQDAFTRNLFFRKGQLVAIDWGYVGIAPIGAELAPLVGTASNLSGFPSEQLDELDQACFNSYLEGIKEAGGNPDPQQVRLGFTLTMGLRYVLGGVVGETLPFLLHEETKHFFAESLGVSQEESEKTDPGMVAYYQKILIEMLKRLGLGFTLRFLGQMVLWSIRLAGKRK
jgi:hypothetical protein